MPLANESQVRREKLSKVGCNHHHYALVVKHGMEGKHRGMQGNCCQIYKIIRNDLKSIGLSDKVFYVLHSDGGDDAEEETLRLGDLMLLYVVICLCSLPRNSCSSGSSSLSTQCMESPGQAAIVAWNDTSCAQY